MLTARPNYLLLCCALLPVLRAQTTWYVDDSATPPYLGTGSQPFLEIQDAIGNSQVQNGDLVLVRPGYYSGIDFQGKAIHIQSLQGSSVTMIGAQGSAVTFLSGETNASVLEGFAISGHGGTFGYGKFGYVGWCGAGVLSPWSSPVIKDCVISGVIDTCLVSGGNAFGGGVYASSTTVLQNCTIRACTLRSCDEGIVGGAGVVGGRLSGCIIEDNVAMGQSLPGLPLHGAGALFSRLDDSVVRNNTALGGDQSGQGYPPPYSEGGGVFACELTRCVLIGNTADIGAGASGYAGNTVTLCTFFANEAAMTGGGCAGPISVDSSILWGNSPNEVSGSTLSFCDVNDAALATGTNFREDPLFWNINVNDIHLRPGSPCIDSGNPALLEPDGSIADVGAFPFDTLYCSAPNIYCTAKTNSLGCAPDIAWFGAPSATNPNPFWITCTNVINQKTGMLFYGHQRNATLFQGGTLCAQQPLRRSLLLFSGGTGFGADCSGDFSFDFNAWTRSGVDPSLVHGSRVNAQFWYRDPPTPSTTGLSNAIEFVICD